ncbi:hypothetical protein TorRG33x02_275230 [Trema orientale]|uniref:Uncharacterized protein n=1 Tax=Trema orientale TaxID=63057 RepID=A0A2P5CS07_TREOI|nr:hypothetical protein TorRG33x02_275230 [Trema orientale]
MEEPEKDEGTMRRQSVGSGDGEDGDGDGHGGSPPSIVVVLLVILRVRVKLGQRNVENFSEKIRVNEERRFLCLKKERKR